MQEQPEAEEWRLTWHSTAPERLCSAGQMLQNLHVNPVLPDPNSGQTSTALAEHANQIQLPPLPVPFTAVLTAGEAVVHINMETEAAPGFALDSVLAVHINRLQVTALAVDGNLDYTL